MRTTKLLATAGLLGASALTALLGAGTAFAGSGDSGSSGDDKAPTEAGTSFRTAQEVEQGRRATAGASTGDYLYWSFPADAGQRPTVKATVKLPDSAARPSGATWRIDVYDGLRRRQSCMYGTQSRAAAPDATSVDLSCTLRTVRAWSEQWANDPLPGTYYVRLTAATLTPSDQGLPVSAEVEVTSKEVGGSSAVDGSLAAPSCRARRRRRPLPPPTTPPTRRTARRPARRSRRASPRTAGPPAGGRTAGSGRRRVASWPRSPVSAATP